MAGAEAATGTAGRARILIACHAAAAADDFVFTQYYPVLTAGKGAGDDAGGGTQSQLGNDG